MTEWREIPSIPEYEVSESGEVRRCKPGQRSGRVGKVMKPHVRQDGYRMYILRHDGRSIHKKAHQLVIEAFVGPKPFDGAEVRHKDGTRTNDHFTNLEWGTSADNKADMLRHGTKIHGERSHHAKLTLAQVREIRSLAATGTLSQRQIGERYGVKQTQVGRIVRGVRWRYAA